jgi:hypothetical protein
MSTEINNFAKLRTIADSVRDLEDAVKRLAAFRNEMIRELRREGVSAIALATALDFNRARVYQILEESDPEVDAREVALMLDREASRLDGSEHELSYQDWLTEFVAVSLVTNAA